MKFGECQIESYICKLCLCNVGPWSVASNGEEVIKKFSNISGS